MKKISVLKRTAFVAIGIWLNVFVMNVHAASDPEIVITHIPKTGEGGVAEGRVAWSELTSNNAGQYAVIAMLRASWGDDYVKPTNDNYLNAVDGSGYFSINITTGGSGDYAIEDVSFFFVRRETFNGIAGSSVKYGTMNGKYLGQPKTVNRTQFWADRLQPPVPNIMPGFARAGENITLSGRAGESIRYTLDGSDPLTSATARTYTSGTSLKTPASGSLLVKAVTSKSGSYSSVVSLLWLPREDLDTPFWGLNVSLALNGEPFGFFLPEETTRTRLAPIAKLTKWIRTHGTLNNGLPYINRIAKNELNLHTMIGVYITNNDAENNAQIQGLRQILETGPAPDLISVGNECSLAGVSPVKLAACIDAVREAVKSQSLVIPVGSVDIAGASWSMSVLDRLDFVGVNIYNGTWDATPESQMVAKMKQSYVEETAKYQPKMVLLGETGSPYAGGAYTADGTTQTPSTSKAVSYLGGFLEWIHGEDIPAFYFEAYDEPVKSQNGGHPIEQYFGILDGNLQVHPFYQALINTHASNAVMPRPAQTALNPYPNPVKDVFILGGLPPGAAIEIYDMSGILALSLPSPALQNSGGIIDISDLPGGVYLVKAGASACKIIKAGK
ncbi:MAG: T9SS type A sorting domain-containing protein [Tannerellaceae bacterium]|nr:T9SS type A sorting domain-containing protein [Tannerellaceae bacterium]